MKGFYHDFNFEKGLLETGIAVTPGLTQIECSVKGANANP